MIDLTKITQDEFTELKEIALKAEEKSPMSRDNYIFDIKSSSVAEVYCFAYRFLFNVHTMIDKGDLKTALEQELKLNRNTYENIRKLKEGIAKNNLFVKIRERKLFNLTQRKEVYELIDLLGALLEKTDLISMTKFKGVLLEGNSKVEFARFQKEFQSV